jgi:hypothetical protein
MKSKRIFILYFVKKVFIWRSAGESLYSILLLILFVIFSFLKNSMQSLITYLFLKFKVKKAEFCALIVRYIDNSIVNHTRV